MLGTQSPENQLQTMSDTAKERAELWEEDPVVEEILQEKIEKNYREKSCGSVPGNIITQFLADEKPKLHYKRILSQFRATLSPLFLILFLGFCKLKNLFFSL